MSTPRRGELFCGMCGVDIDEIGEYPYMVLSHLWPAGYRFLCIGCLEALIGRTLERIDFARVPINALPLWFRRSDRLRARQGL